MANIENVKRAIAVMRSVPVEKFDIKQWFGECGTVACFAGHLALSPDIPEITVEPGRLSYEDQVMVFLDIEPHEACDLCGLNNSEDVTTGERYDEFYWKHSNEVTPQDVIVELERFLVET